MERIRRRTARTDPIRPPDYPCLAVHGDHSYIVAMPFSKYLGEFEQMVVLTILHLDNDAYGLSIRRELEARIGRMVSHGAAYTTLDRLEDKGLLTSRLGDPVPGRGGRPKRYFEVTPAGVQALRDARGALVKLWNGLEAVLGDL